MKSPLVIFAFVFSLGIALSGSIKIPLALAFLLAFLFLIFSFLTLHKSARFNIFICLFILTLGSTALINEKVLPKSHISKLITYRNTTPYMVTGYVLTPSTLKHNKSAFVLRARELQIGNLKYGTCGDILVYIDGDKNFSSAEQLIFSGNLYRPFSKNNLSKASYKDYLRNQGIYCIMKAKSYRRTLKANRGLSLKRFCLNLKEGTKKKTFPYLSGISQSIFSAMVLGERRNIPALLNSNMVKSGTVHILVVSGFNVGIVAFIVILFLKLFRLPRKIRLSLAIPCLIIYCFITGASTPVVRATVMAIIIIFGYLIKREADIYNSLAIAALFILLAHPGQLFDIGFQLSFMSVLSIICIYPRIRLFLRIGCLKSRYLKFLLDSLLVSFAAWAGTLWFIAYYFSIFSPITVFANLLIVPIATLITFCGFSIISAGVFFVPLTHYFALTFELLASLLININNSLIRFPWAYFNIRV